MLADHYVWFAWATAFLIPWLILYIAFPADRRAMLWASLFPMPFGLTEPLFVPKYWNPPSLFDLFARTGFDIESLIFCFRIGGVGATLYNVSTNKAPLPVEVRERRQPLHRHHYLAHGVPFLAFPVLYVLPWNPIYTSIAAMLIAAVANIACRPDVKTKTWVGGILFIVYYWVFIVGLGWLSLGYIGRVWNFGALTGIRLFGAPLEEILFAGAFGMYRSGVYEHFIWRRLA